MLHVLWYLIFRNEIVTSNAPFPLSGLARLLAEGAVVLAGLFLVTLVTAVWISSSGVNKLSMKSCSSRLARMHINALALTKKDEQHWNGYHHYTFCRRDNLHSSSIVLSCLVYNDICWALRTDALTLTQVANRCTRNPTNVQSNPTWAWVHQKRKIKMGIPYNIET